MILTTDIPHILDCLEKYDMHVHVIDHDDISCLKEFPISHIHNSEVYVMKGDEIVFLGSRRGVLNFIQRFDQNYNKYNVT